MHDCVVVEISGYIVATPIYWVIGVHHRSDVQDIHLVVDEDAEGGKDFRSKKGVGNFNLLRQTFRRIQSNKTTKQCGVEVLSNGDFTVYTQRKKIHCWSNV
jgi:hypothetical protein